MKAILTRVGVSALMAGLALVQGDESDAAIDPDDVRLDARYYWPFVDQTFLNRVS